MSTPAETSAHTPATTLSRPLALPCGATLPNRIMKSALSETLGTLTNEPTERLPTLYRRWSKGGAGLLVTGNVFVDKRAVGEPRAVAFDGRRDLELLSRWARAGRYAGSKIWVQINHAGKQVPRMVNSEPVAPSAVALDPTLRRFFNPPRELTSREIWDIVGKFGRAAAIAREAGFDGVQIHGAHGYLVSQFLSPRHNVRDDEWGGSAERRRRFVLEVYRAVRGAVGDDFPVAIKLNSADFLRGGFSEDESLDAVRALADAGVDLIEISGGSYEKPAMMGAARGESGNGEDAPAAPIKASTAAREAHFIAFAERVRGEVDVPLAVTGGFHSAAGMAAAIDSGAVDLVGLGRPLIVAPDLPRRVLAGEAVDVELPTVRTGIKRIDQLFVSELVWYQQQIHRMARGKPPRQRAGAWRALLGGMMTMLVQSVRRRRLLAPKTPRGLAQNTAA